MKKLLLLTLLMSAIEISFAQTASDYYMPLCAGNQTVLYTAQAQSWAGRTTTYTIIKTDSIGGELYYVEEGIEYVFDDSVPPHPFHYLWLKKDVNGEILLKAYSDEYPVLDSAEILPAAITYFSNSYFTEGYSNTITNGSETETDSVVSTHAAFDIFNNCIQIRAIRRISGVVDRISDNYYASGVGYVGGGWLFPVNEIHTDGFASAFVTGCDPIVDTIPPNTVDTCLGLYFDYYISDIQVDTINHTVTVTWVFQDDTVTNEFIQTYNYQYPGNNVISITIQCSKTVTTYYQTVNISSSQIGINEHAGTNPSINIYPNPASEMFIVKNTRNNNEALTLYIYNVLGDLVRTTSWEQNQQQIDISDLSDGVYVVEIKSKEWNEKLKLIVQR